MSTSSMLKLDIISFLEVQYLQNLASKLVHRPAGGERSGQHDRQATTACDKSGHQPAPLHPLKEAIQYNRVRRQIETEKKVWLYIDIKGVGVEAQVGIFLVHHI